MYPRSRFLPFAVAAALTILPPSLSISVAATETTARRVVDISNIAIDNIGRINANYFRGEQPDGRDYEDLAALGIRTVIDLQADGENHDEEQRVKTAGMTFYRIPMTTRVPPTADQIAQFLRIVNDPAQQPVYVHCKGGKHRTGVMSALYRMERDGWTADQAYREMKQYKFGPSFLHPEFKRFVYEYERGRVAASTAAAER